MPAKDFVFTFPDQLKSCVSEFQLVLNNQHDHNKHQILLQAYHFTFPAYVFVFNKNFLPKEIYHTIPAGWQR